VSNSFTPVVHQPAREVGGDFYDLFELDDGRLGLVVGDVTDKGIPTALVMATTRTMLRASAQRLFPPAEVLKRANDALVADIPPNMFITCLYAILDTESGVSSMPTPATTHPTCGITTVMWRSSG
jgi:serine phosphatase RsbU (regulator of sigma subunit)